MLSLGAAELWAPRDMSLSPASALAGAMRVLTCSGRGCGVPPSLSTLSVTPQPVCNAQLKL